MKAARVFQLTALALVVVSAVQVGWWIYDQHAYAVEKVRAARAAYLEQTAAAQALLDAGVTPERVQQLLPGSTATITVDGATNNVTVRIEWTLPGGSTHHYETQSNISAKSA